MTPQQLKDKLYVSVKRGTPNEIRVGIRLEAVINIDDDNRIDEAIEIGKNDIVNGVYGGRREEFRKLLNTFICHSKPHSDDNGEYFAARTNLSEFYESL